MTERYTQFYTEEFSEVRDIQETLLLPETPQAGGGIIKKTRMAKHLRRKTGKRHKALARSKRRI
jgi:hypothetical protein